MSTSIDNAFVRQYEADVKDIYQREGGILRPTVRTKDSVLGKSTTFQKIGKGMATVKARHGVITPMNQSHTAIECTLSDFYAGDWVDHLDEAKTNIDERMAIARGGAWALGRKVDDQLLTVMDDTTNDGNTITLTSAAAVKGTMLDWVKELWVNDVPNDGNCYGLLSPLLDAVLQLVDGYNSADFVPSRPLVEGAPVLMFRRWLGVNWAVHTGLSGVGTGTCKSYVWHRDAVGYASAGVAGDMSTNPGGDSIMADITWHGDRAAHFVNHMMSGGACLIDDGGVHEATWTDSGAVPTS